MKALIFENKLMQVEAVEFDVHSSMIWIDVPDDCDSSWVYTDGTVSPYVEPTDTRTYAELRKREYDLLNQDEMRFDDLENGTTTWQDAINAIKDANPKP